MSIPPKQAVIVGTGGHAQVLWASWQAAKAAGVSDLPDLVGWLDVSDYAGPETLHGLPVFRQTDLGLHALRERGITGFWLGIGMIRAGQQRWEIYQTLRGVLEPLSLVHPTAVVDPAAVLEPGCFVGARAVVQPFAHLGEACIVNTGAIVEHHVRLGANVHVAPASVLCGEVQVGAHSLVGASSVVLQQRTVGEQCTIGAGSAVLTQVPDHTLVAGSPAVLKASCPASAHGGGGSDGSGWSPVGSERASGRTDRRESRVVPAHAMTPVHPAHVLLLGKQGDPYFAKAKAFALQHFAQVTVVQGNRHQPLPDEVRHWEGDYLVSYLSPWIIPGSVLSRARRAAINFHPGPPEYPGIGCTNFALYHQARDFGITCHHMEPTVDTGQMIAVRRFPVLPSETVYSLTQRCYAEILTLFCEVMTGIVRGEPLPTSPEHWTRRPYKRVELNALCRLTPEMDAEEVRRRVHALRFPGMPGAYLMVGDQRFVPVDPADDQAVWPTRGG